MGLGQILRRWSPILNVVILTILFFTSAFVRIFSVIRFESIIHEFDPWFNFRATKLLVSDGINEFWNWFDSESWYPLGRVTGGTLYPGIMFTAGGMHWLAHSLGFPVDIRNVCVFIGPIFSGLTNLVTYFFAKEVTGKSGAGLVSALFISLIPSYISRSVAGSYDYEAISIFALINTFWLWIKAVNSGRVMHALLCALAYFYMVASWGGYVFIINAIPIYVIGMIIIGRYSQRLYVAYSVFYFMGSILSMQIPFVGAEAIISSEHMASHAVFMFLQIYVGTAYLRRLIGEEKVRKLFWALAYILVSVIIIGCLWLTLAGYTRWSGRSLTLLDPTYAKKYIPIVASVSEHQATTWTSYFFDLHYTIIFAPLGLYFCFMEQITDGKIFVALYGVLAVYFSGVMVRLLLVFAPAVCVLSGIGISHIFSKFCRSFLLDIQDTMNKETKPKSKVGWILAAVPIIIIWLVIAKYIFHCTYAGAEAYSSPSVVMSSRNYQDESRYMIDDYREAYYWLRTNTPTNAKIASWWDYGYQIKGFADRNVLVDNNTWNHTHIATVGMGMASNEEDSYEIFSKLDVDYVLVIFGGMAGYSGDDINKFLWMVRIGGGVFPRIKESDYLARSIYRIDSLGTPTMLNSLMYTLCYYRFGEVQTRYQQPAGFDAMRNVEIGRKDYKLTKYTEAFTSENWIVRIFKLNPPNNRGSSITPVVKYNKIADLKKYRLTTDKTNKAK